MRQAWPRISDRRRSDVRRRRFQPRAAPRTGANARNPHRLRLSGPMVALDPCFTVASQLGELIGRREKLGGAKRHERALELLRQVGLPDRNNTAAHMIPMQISLARHTASMNTSVLAPPVAPSVSAAMIAAV